MISELIARGNKRAVLLGSVFGRTDFSRIFIFGPPDFFADFVAGFFLLIFVGKSAQKNPPGKSPAKSSKFYTTKILRHISADWPEQVLSKGDFRECAVVPGFGTIQRNRSGWEGSVAPPESLDALASGIWVRLSRTSQLLTGR